MTKVHCAARVLASMSDGEGRIATKARFLAKLHPRRFEAARAAHPWETGVQLARRSARRCNAVQLPFRSMWLPLKHLTKVDVLTTSDGLAFGVGVYSGAVEELDVWKGLLFEF